MKLFTILYNNSIRFCLKNSIKTFLYYIVKLDSKFKKNSTDENTTGTSI